MNLAPVINLLRQRIGLDPSSLGATTLSRAVAARMRALAITASEPYAGHLASDEQEFQLLLSALVVPETWFFRGGEIFTYLAGQVAEVVRLRGREKRYRILSVPCSTGEEPYSLAIALAEAGVACTAWTIEAIDLSSEHIARAQRARFGNFSFRQTTPELRARYFQPVEEDWELARNIRSRVRFRQGNVLDALFLAREGAFDLILCRNLFIYLHPDARQQTLTTIERLLTPDGWLCTGHADPVEFQDSRFARTGPVGYFLYRRTAQSERRPPALAELSRPPAMENASAVSASTSAEPSPTVDSLGRARQEADGGKLTEAFASCQEQLARFGPSADLYSLMGVIHQARRENDEAVRCYQRALYLEREHTEALTQLMLLSQEKGDDAQAERLRRRLERVAAGGDP